MSELSPTIIENIKKVASNKFVQARIVSAMLSGQYELDTDLWEALEQVSSNLDEETFKLLWGERYDEDEEDEPDDRGLYGEDLPHLVMSTLVEVVGKHVEQMVLNQV